MLSSQSEQNVFTTFLRKCCLASPQRPECSLAAQTGCLKTFNNLFVLQKRTAGHCQSANFPELSQDPTPICFPSNPVPFSLCPDHSHYKHVSTKYNIQLESIRTGEGREDKGSMKSVEYCYSLSPEVKSPLLCSYQTYPFPPLSIYTLYL